MSETKQFTVTPERWAYGGEVIARLPDGRAVFIPFALPGEVVRIEVGEEKRGFARARLLEVLDPCAKRIAPRCRHFTHCGGCHYQHLDYPDQFDAKTAALRDTLERIGSFDPEELDQLLKPFVPAPNPWHYRNHIQFHLDPQGRLGFLVPRSDTVIPIEECHLPEEALNQLWPQLQLEPVASLDLVSLRVGVEDEIMLVLETDDDEGLEFELDIPLAAVQLGPETLHILSDSAQQEMAVLDYTFRVSAGVFFQVNTAMAAKMVEHLLAHLPLTPQSTVLDLYCGMGLFSAFIAPEVGRLIGIEEHPLAVEDFAHNLDAFDNVEIYQAPAEAVMPQLEVQPDVIVADPPRAGLALPVLDAIIAMKPGTLAYVSCDPATFARDAKRLRAAGFTLRQITPFDMFPQTYHIETISLWGAPGE
ncbi:MAG: class I SAM-dependent RNA methyltransferase [Anaerolineales bacterium]|nr:class I SAM-dependent RNA methyltransferase [Anaerolineales bacterium]